MRILTRINAAFGRWFGRDDGNATIEFVILFPAVLTLFLSSFEVGYFLVRTVLLDRAVDLNVRALRLGTMSPPTQAELKRRICNDALILPNCMESLSVELTPISTETWTFPANQIACVDRDEEIQVPTTHNQGLANDLMIVRACVVLDPFFTTTPLVMDMPLDASGGYRISAVSTFVNEP